MYKKVVSVITPSFNSQDYLSETIESVLTQTFGDWEMIIIDDCSDDESYSIAQQFSKEDERIRSLRLSKNSGAAVARNKGIELAEGRYIAFLDSDDLWKPDKLKKQVKFMRQNNYLLTYTYYKMINESGEDLEKIINPPARITYADLLKANHVGCLTAMYDSKKIGKVYMPNILKRQDYGLWLKILKNNVEFAYCIKEPLALYRRRNNSISNNKLEMVRYHWRLFRQVEKLSRPKAVYYLGWNIWDKLKQIFK